MLTYLISQTVDNAKSAYAVIQFAISTILLS